MTQLDLRAAIVELETAVAGGLFGFLLAYAVVLGGLPRWLRTALMTFSGVVTGTGGANTLNQGSNAVLVNITFNNFP